MRLVSAALCVVITLSPAMVALAAAPVVVNQVRRAFSVRELHVRRGETVRFINVDEFLHQIFIDSKVFSFTSKEQPPGEVIDVVFPTTGSFTVRCEIHPKMSLNITVE